MHWLPQRHPSDGVHSTVRELQTLVGQRSLVEHLDLLTTVKHHEKLFLQPVVTGTQIVRHLDLDIIDDQVGQRVVVLGRHLQRDVTDQLLDGVLGVLIRHLFVRTHLLVEPGAESRLAGAQTFTPVHHEELTVQVFVPVAGRCAGETRGPLELVSDLAKRLDPVRAGVLHLADLVPDNPVERHRAILLNKVRLQRFGQPAEVLIVHQVHVSRAQESTGALILGARDHVEPEVPGVLPLRSLLSPHQPDHADRSHDDHATKELGADQVGQRGQCDHGLAQTHVEPQHRVGVGALEVDGFLLVAVEQVRCQHVRNHSGKSSFE